MLDKTNASFENKLLAKIKDCKICPKPRWQFLLKNYIVWLSGILSLLIGSAAISVMIYLFKFNDWNIYEQTEKSFLEFFILTLPYFWLIFMALFVFIISYNFKHTKKGYRYSSFILAGISVILSIVLGSLFFVAGVGEKLDDILGRQMPFYDQVINRHIDFWSRPDEGRLSGIVIEKSDDYSFILIDRGEETWLVDTSFAKPYPREMIEVGQPIRTIGKTAEDNNFSADLILPVNAGRGFFRRFEGRKLPMPMQMRGEKSLKDK